MAMGQQKDRQRDLMVGWAEMPRSPGHVFYDGLQSIRHCQSKIPNTCGRRRTARLSSENRAYPVNAETHYM